MNLGSNRRKRDKKVNRIQVPQKALKILNSFKKVTRNP